MTRFEYMEELKLRLRGLSDDEIKDALNYCDEYFNEAQSEAQAILDLGIPRNFANQLKADATMRLSLDESQEKQRVTHTSPRSFKSIWIMILGIFALPIALPLGLALIILIFSMMLLVACLVLTAILVVAAFFIGGVLSLASGFYYFDGGTGQSILALGLGLFSIGISIFFGILFTLLLRRFVPQLTIWLGRIYQRYRRKDLKI